MAERKKQDGQGTENSFLRIFHKRTIKQLWDNSLSPERFIQSPSLQERLGNSSSSQNSLKILGIVIKSEEAGRLPQDSNGLSGTGADHCGCWWRSTWTSVIRLLCEFCSLWFNNCPLLRIALLPRSHVSVSRSNHCNPTVPYTGLPTISASLI